MNSITELIKKLENLFNKIEESDIEIESEQKKYELLAQNSQIGNEMLELINQVLTNDKVNFKALEFRVKLNNGLVFNEINKVIEDSEFVIENATKLVDKIEAFKWLSDVYENQLNLPLKSLEINYEKLIFVHQLPKENRSIIDDHLSFTYYKIAKFEEIALNEKTALKYYKLSFESKAYLHERNYNAGLLFLKYHEYKLANELLTLYFDYFPHSDNFESGSGKIANELEKLYHDNLLDENVELICLYFHIVRNNLSLFELKNEKDFLDRYFTFIEEISKKNPTKACGWRILGNVYLYDIKNNKKAYDAYLNYLKCSDHYCDVIVERIVICANKLGYQIKDIPFTTQGKPNELYQAMSSMYGFWYNGDENSRYNKVYLDWAKFFGEIAYKQFYAYFNESVENPNAYCNSKSIYSHTCNDYGLTLRNLTENENGKFNKETLIQTHKIHFDGYKIFPSEDNLLIAIWNAFEVNDYEICVEYLKELLEFYDPIDENLDPIQIQRNYWRIAYCYSEINQDEKIEEIYYIQKAFFDEHADETVDIVEFMIRTAGLHFWALIISKKYEECIEKIDEFNSNDVFKRVVFDEYSKSQYYKAICFKELGENQKALAIFEEVLPVFKKTELSYLKTLEYKTINYIQVLKGEENIEQKIIDFSNKPEKKLQNFPLDIKSKEKNIDYLWKLIFYLTSKEQRYNEIWVNDNYFIRTQLKEPQEDKTAFDSILYVYYKDLNQGYDFINVEYKEEEEESSFFGLKKRTVLKDKVAFWARYRNYNDVDGNWSEANLDKTPKEFKDKAQQIWNELVSKIMSK